jgi:hypothetical protein
MTPSWRPTQLSEFTEMMAKIRTQWSEDHPNAGIASFLADEAKKLAPEEKTGVAGRFSWDNYTCFWPPRVIKAVQQHCLVAFFGAGLSIPSGLMSWSELLGTYFGLSSGLIDDSDLKTDPLTLAELAAHQLGTDQLQTVLRAAVAKVGRPSVSHVTAAALRLPFYITTNYDDLFERAFAEANEGVVKLRVITNSADLAAAERDNPGLTPLADISYLIKLHGCVSRKTEHLILTRSDYRRHYRFNREFFDKIVNLLIDYHVLFLGFSHSDPEIGRIVEDAIWQAQAPHGSAAPAGELERQHRHGPNLYSLQYGMRTHTPEIFAAKGIVALRPSVAAALPDPRTAAVSRSLADLIWASQAYDSTDDLDPILDSAVRRLGDSLDGALGRLERCSSDALSAIQKRGGADLAWMRAALSDLGQLAGQGLYLVDARGAVIASQISDELNHATRSGRRSFSDRPYFRQAQTFRKPFVSDCLPSAFNENSTFMLCAPIVDTALVFHGLLFAACQIGFWPLPIEIAKETWEKRYSFLLVDSNGVCLLPPRDEFKPRDVAIAGEASAANRGYEYAELLGLSRRDRLVTRVMENVVPIDQDDDVLPLSQDFTYYAVLAELKQARWKLAIASPIKLFSLP